MAILAVSGGDFGDFLKNITVEFQSFYQFSFHNKIL